MDVAPKIGSQDKYNAARAARRARTRSYERPTANKSYRFLTDKELDSWYAHVELCIKKKRSGKVVKR